MISTKNIKQMDELYNSYMKASNVESIEFLIIKLYNQTKNQKKWKSLYKDKDKSFFNLFKDQDELKNSQIDSEITIFNYKSLDHILSNLFNSRKNRELNSAIRDKKIDDFLTTLHEKTDHVWESYQNSIETLLEEPPKKYQRLTISKENNYLVFKIIDSFGYGFGYNCEIEEAMEEDEILTEDDVDVDEIKMNEVSMMNDLKSEGSLYNFILNNIDILNHIQTNYLDINSILHKKYDDKIESLLKNIEENKLFELKYIEFSFLIKKIDEDSFIVYKKVGDLVKKIYNSSRYNLSNLKSLIINNIETKAYE
jgi:hypothetical protein